MVINRLAAETSPYLLQHADNPVDWFPWGDEAFEEARRRDVPIFLSVGYSSCHWCHVMAHESFEDDEVARVLNERFVNVKVDREERPDVDQIYMDAVTALTGHGGWPMSVFLTHDGRPFYGGTYWPRDDRMGMPGFLRVLDAIAEAWRDRRDEIEETAGEIADAIRSRTPTSTGSADPTVADRALVGALQQWDRRLGGFGRAPKFPQAMALEWLVSRHARMRPETTEPTGDDDPLTCVLHSLDAMARGGLYDQVGGGFHRYSTDARWLVPHFEKMLYDNALLAPLYAQAAAISGDPHLDRIARETADYLLREMRHEHGGFFSATDADSEGEEGRYFVWTYDELTDVIRGAGSDPELFAAFFGARPDGNWEEDAGYGEPVNILHEPVHRERFCADRSVDLVDFTAELDRVRDALRSRRSERVPPGLDDKVLTSWSALAVRGLVLTGMHLGLPEYVDAATESATFLHEGAMREGRLHRVWKDGRASIPAFLEDLAYLALACLELYAATGDRQWFARAIAHASDARERFHDPDGGFFQTPEGGERLYTRPKETWDNATPSGNSVMAEVSLRIAGYTGDAAWRDILDEIVALFQRDAERAPTGFGWLLRVCEGLLADQREIAVVGAAGPERSALLREVWRIPRPGAVIAVAEGPSAEIPLLDGREPVDGRPAAYVCEGFVCKRPVTDAGELRSQLAV